MGARARVDFAELSPRLADRMADLARALTAAEPTARSAREWRFRSRGSLAVVVAGPNRGAWHDHEAGVGGDPVGLIAHLRGVPMRDALTWALAWLGQTPHHRSPAAADRHVAPPQATREASGAQTVDLARRVWQEGQPPTGTLVQTYLAARGLMVPEGAPLRFHPACPRGAERWPAMLALMTDAASGEAVGVHRTFLASDGSGKAPVAPAKMMLGRAGIVRLGPDAAVTIGIGIAEGTETALAIMQAYAWSPIWAAGSAGAIANSAVLPGIQTLTIFADPDGAGIAAAETCVARWAAAGREARICTPPGCGDFDDLARQGAA